MDRTERAAAWLVVKLAAVAIIGLNIALDGRLAGDEIIFLNMLALPFFYPLGYLIGDWLAERAAI